MTDKSGANNHKAEWVLVPRVATEEMLSNFYAVACGQHPMDYRSVRLTKRQLARAQSAYGRMIAAAPAASEGEDFQTQVALMVGADEEDQADILSHLREWMKRAKAPAAQVAATPKPRCGNERHELDAYIWKRDSEQEWVLEISGEINGTSFISRHTEPLTTPPEDVAGLPSLYERLEAATPKHDEGWEAMVAALASIWRYGADTLSGRADGPDDRDWQCAAVKEMTKRAREALPFDPRSEDSRDAMHAALASQPAARRVPTVVAWYVFADTEAWVTADEHEADKNRSDGLHVRPLIFGDMVSPTADNAAAVAALQAERDALRKEVGEVREAYQARTRDWYSQGDALDAAEQRAERAESALEALRGQVAGLVEALSELADAGEDAWGAERPCVRDARAELLAMKNSGEF